MKKLLSSIYLTLVGLLISCQPTEQKVMRHYQSYPEYFQEFVNTACSDLELLRNRNKAITFDRLIESTQISLRKLDLSEVSHVILSGTECDEIEGIELEIIFNGNWHLKYEPCEYSRSDGQYQEIGFIEMWKIDDQWFLWVNNDFIG